MNRNKNRIVIIWLIIGLVLGTSYKLISQDASMVKIPDGYWRPFFKGTDTLISVSTFYLDKKQVTNEEYEQFVAHHPEWSSEKVKPVFADENYLIHWKNRSESDQRVLSKQPVINVSWFAARAYCRSLGKRLPTTAEWEYAASALPIGRSINDSILQEIIANWYSRRIEAGKPVGSIYENSYGLWDMYGQVWEWVLDFDAMKSSDDSRGQDVIPQGLFCGSASLDVVDASDYTGFIRFAFRSSLKGNYTVRNLGFRCAADEAALP